VDLVHEEGGRPVVGQADRGGGFCAHASDLGHPYAEGEGRRLRKDSPIAGFPSEMAGTLKGRP
jgi:hypothetical protein